MSYSPASIMDVSLELMLPHSPNPTPLPTTDIPSRRSPTPTPEPMTGFVGILPLNPIAAVSNMRRSSSNSAKCVADGAQACSYECNCKRAEITRDARQLQKECIAFIEHQVEQGCSDVHFPIWYTIGYNLLRTQCWEHGVQVPVLDALPQAVTNAMLAEFGPQPTDGFPQLRPDGLLQGLDEPLVKEGARVMCDTIDYVMNALAVTERLPKSPIAFAMSMYYLDQELSVGEHTMATRTLIKELPTTVQKFLVRHHRTVIPNGYIARI